MHKIMKTLSIVGLAAGLFAGSAAAQSNNAVGGAIIGGTAGAIIGGAATGKAGGAIAGGIIGAAAGAMLGSQLEARHGGYYWYDGRCWRRHGDGSYHLVKRHYCD